METNVGAGAEGGLNLPAVYVALLRGINVGGKNRVPMARLEGIFRAAGCTDVTTYIQSGNVIFRSEDRLVSRVPELVMEHSGCLGRVMKVAEKLESRGARCVKEDRAQCRR